MTQSTNRSPYEEGSTNWLDKPIEIAELTRRLVRRGIPVKDSTVYRWARTGKIPVTRLGRFRSTVRSAEAALRPEAS